MAQSSLPALPAGRQAAAGRQYCPYWGKEVDDLGNMEELFHANLEGKFDVLRGWADEHGFESNIELLDKDACAPHKGTKYQYKLVIDGLEAGNVMLFAELDQTAEDSGFQQGTSGWYYIREDKEDGLPKDREKLFA